MCIEMPLESASLTQLQQTPIDNVLNIIDEGLVHLPSYRELFYRWERQQWLAQEIDFAADRLQWQAMTPQGHQDRMYGLSAFFKGEACVTDTLGPYIIAMPDEEMRIFLTTQLSDEARHTVFFARFFREVLGVERDTLEDTLEVTHDYMNAQLQYLLMDALSEVAERIRQEPRNIAHLVEGITLYHVIVEGTLALTGQRNILDFYRQNNFFPAFRGGFTAVARDESRHVIFGVKFLREMIQRDANNAMIVHNAVEKYTPTALEGIYPSPQQVQSMLANGEDPWTTPRYAQESLAKKLKVIGLSMKLPPLPVQGM